MKPIRTSAVIALLAFCAGAHAQDQSAEARALAERRQHMIEECIANHGSEVDCVRETDTELRAEGLLGGVRLVHLRPPR